MPVRLRGHHFLCILTYKGEGYSPNFVANMSLLVSAISAGRYVALVTGADDICAGLTENCRATIDHDCNATDTLHLDQLAIDAVSALLERDLSIAQPLTSNDIALLREAYALGTIRAACADCAWKSLCDSIARSGFEGARL